LITFTLQHRVLLSTSIGALVAVVPLFLFSELSPSQSIFLFIGIFLLILGITRLLLAKYSKGLAALETGLLNIKDGEYSTSLAYQGNDEFASLCKLYNETVDKLRTEKHWLFQRELLLDKITQNSTNALLLVNDKNQIIFSNLAARNLFKSQFSLEGYFLDKILKKVPIGFREMLLQMRDGLFSVQDDNNVKQTWHLSVGTLLLNNQTHRLLVLKQLTRELSRQEVAVWKKVIRIISHELNNSLGPISSMLHSGQIIASSIKEEKLSRVFNTIEERIHHLSDFVQGYGKFAKLPEPKLRPIVWLELVTKLKEQWECKVINRQHETESSDIILDADPIQLEQLLINLLKNAHESHSPVDDITVCCYRNASYNVIEVSDRGVGMSDAVMTNALIPFYSTKSAGSSLGLALCREIVDAHHGHIAFRNRKQSGLTVSISLPIEPNQTLQG
jgi:nitrogen fixation/metabolism regulation signal transduction histidine kinase